MKKRRAGRAGAERLVILLGLWSLCGWSALRFFPAGWAWPADREALSAASLMAEALAAIRSCREAGGIPIDPVSDPNRTGLIGLSDSPITTSPGHLEAKRTTTNPNFAAALVFLFREAGLQAGDAVAVGASSSFPGLILATLAASKAMQLRPLPVVSLGASNWGANDPRWTWLEIADCLEAAGIVEAKPLAASVGGEGDAGRDMSPRGRAVLEAKARSAGIPLLVRPDLPSDVAARLDVFERAAEGAPLKAFVNVGGSWVNMGTDAGVLALKPGLNWKMPIPPPERRGLIQEMSLRGTPVIHLLFVKGLADRFGLPWDPVPLPAPGQEWGGAVSGRGPTARPVVLAVYLLGALAGLIQLSRRASM